jgi:hypothetical protein
MAPEANQVFSRVFLKFTSYGGGLGYLHSSSAKRKRQRKGNPVPGVNCVPTVSFRGHEYRDLALNVGGGGFSAGLPASFRKRITVVVGEEVKTGSNPVELIDSRHYRSTRCGMDAVEKRNNVLPLPGIEFRSFSSCPVATSMHNRALDIL